MVDLKTTSRLQKYQTVKKLLQISPNRPLFYLKLVLAGMVYFSFDVTVAPNNFMKFERLQVDFTGQNFLTADPTTEIYTSIKGFADPIGDSEGSITINRTATGTYFLDFSGPQFNAMTGTTTVYIPLVINTPGNGRYARLDNLRLLGNAVPEPGSLVVLGLGGIGLGLYRRRQ